MKKYEHILNEIIEDMKSGKLKKGDKLSSLRELSRYYDCNKETVLKALKELKQQNLIYSVEKSGYFVLSDMDEKKRGVDFATSLPDSAQFPFGDFRICMNEVMVNREAYLFDYYDRAQGLKSLTDSFKSLLADYSIYTKEENIVVTSGAQQAIYILSVMLGDAKILIEQPTYHRMNELSKSLNLNYETISRSPDGLDLKRLEEIFSTGEIRYFYTIPRLHNPLGGSLKESEKERLVELADKYGVYIIEDDYMADFDRARSAPLHYYDTSGRVIYIKTFSAIIFPSLRMGAVVLPDGLLDGFLSLKSLMDYDSNLLVQKALSIYIDNGMFAKHRARLVSLYEEKNSRMRRILDSLQVQNYEVFDTKAVFKIRKKSEIATLKAKISGKYKVDFMETSYISRCPYDYVKIDVRNMNIAEIEKNIADLMEILKEYIYV